MSDPEDDRPNRYGRRPPYMLLSILVVVAIWLMLLGTGAWWFSALFD
jgi:Na+/melibiose symporter-like transporter